MTIKQVEMYLLQKGIPRSMIQNIRISLTYDAVTQGHDIQYDRIFTGIALMLRKEFGFGPERIIRGLRRFDNECGSVIDDPEKDWGDLMKELKDETGIVIRTGDDDRLICEIETKEKDNG